MHIPLQLPSHAQVRYVDCLSTAQARRTFPELRHHKLVNVDIVDEAETLGSIQDRSLDFLIANHLLEHCQNPIKALENWLGKLKREGVLFVTIPDMHETFDSERALTSFEHLFKDYNEGPQ